MQGIGGWQYTEAGGGKKALKEKTPSAVEPLPDESEKQKVGVFFAFFFIRSHHNSYIKKERGCMCLKEASPGRNFSRTTQRAGTLHCTALGDNSTRNTM